MIPIGMMMGQLTAPKSKIFAIKKIKQIESDDNTDPQGIEKVRITKISNPSEEDDMDKIIIRRISGSDDEEELDPEDDEETSNYGGG